MHLAAADSFSAIAIFMRADWVVKLVMLGLLLASLWSWAVIIDKLVRFAGLNGGANKFEDQIASGRSLEDIAKQAGEAPKHPLPRMLQTALAEWRDSRARGVAGPTAASAAAARSPSAVWAEASTPRGAPCPTRSGRNDPSCRRR